MSLSNAPRLVKGGLVVLNAAGNAVARSIALQYNPDTLSRSFQVQGAGGEGGEGGGQRATPFRLKGPAIETLKVEAEIDATDGLEFPDQNPVIAEFGVGPQLAALEALVNPTADAIAALDAKASSGVLEIVPPEAPLVLFVWGRQTVLPVRVTDFSFTEEAFDPLLNPIRAKVSLGLRVLSTDDLGFRHRGGALFLAHLRRREQLAGQAGSPSLTELGLSALP
jgi:Contractile injection system tube protein